MTTYTLTDQANTFNGSSGTDVFEGVGGGNDSLRGNAGNDFFTIQAGQTGLLDGGTGDDVLRLVGGGINNKFDANLKISNVEQLIVDASSLRATVSQLAGFDHFGINNNSDDFEFTLQGRGGTLDFSTSFLEPQHLVVNAEMATSAVMVTGSAKADEMFGSDFSDRFDGGKGNDRLYGYAGNDTLNGGLGNDVLYGDEGRDSYLFNTALVGNVDHLGDFRPADDSIKLDRAIFGWTGQTIGTIASSAFKVIGTGQTVDANDRIIYNQTTGGLYYDVDGNKAGGKAAVLFAIADNFAGDVPVITYQDIIIV